MEVKQRILQVLFVLFFFDGKNFFVFVEIAKLLVLCLMGFVFGVFFFPKPLVSLGIMQGLQSEMTYFYIMAC